MIVIFRISVLLIALGFAGCSSGVREDRTIEFSSESSTVGFQHGNDGVFLSDLETGRSEQIYSLKEGEIAASTPQFSDGDSLIFAVASLDGDAEFVGDTRSWDATPQGRRFFAAPTIYKCLHRSSSDATELETLFEARCDHTGYVAANVALRWHPSGESVWFIDKVDTNGSAIYEYTLADKSIRRVTPFNAAALAFDFSPTGEFIACASIAIGGSRSCVRLRAANGDSWRELPLSGLAGDPTADWLEQLRQALPHFAHDDSQCVYRARSEQTIQSDDGTVRWTTQLVQYKPDSHSGTTLWNAAGDVRDIHWHPNGHLLAFIGQTNQLKCISLDDPLAARRDSKAQAKNLLEKEKVRRFAGFSVDGQWLAYTTTEPSVVQKSTYLFSPVDQARDQLFVAAFDPSGVVVDQGTKPVIDSMRLTFPRWSQEQAQLSLWATYSPSHTSRLSTIVPWSMGNGDPAAVVSAQSQSITWLPINPTEEAQVGNYYLMHRHEKDAWDWYARSLEQRSFMQPIKLSQWQLFQQQTLQLQDSTFFEYICLARLGRQSGANERLELFNKHFILDEDDALSLLMPESSSETDHARFAEFVQEIASSCIPVLKASYITEVYLSLDAAEEGITYFQSQSDQRLSPWQRFANRLCHAHLILVTGAEDRYAAFVASELIAAFEALERPNYAMPTAGLQARPELIVQLQQSFLRIATAMAVAPLMSQELTDSLSPATLDLLEKKIDALLTLDREPTEAATLKRILLAVNLSQKDPRAEQLRKELKLQEEPFGQLISILGDGETDTIWPSAQ